VSPPFTYRALRSADLILRRRRVPSLEKTCHGEPGEIEFVADALIGDPAMDWYVQEHGGGVMVIEPKCFGRAFLTETHTAEDLVFVSRAETENSDENTH
jgi:hypothetical protein